MKQCRLASRLHDNRYENNLKTASNEYGTPSWIVSNTALCKHPNTVPFHTAFKSLEVLYRHKYIPDFMFVHKSWLCILSCSPTHFCQPFKELMKRKLSLSYLKEVFKWQSNNLCSFWFSWFVFEIFQFVWYANDLSEKVIYLCHYQTKLIQRNHVRVFIQWHQTCRFSSHFVCQWQRYITFSDKSLCTCDV